MLVASGLTADEAFLVAVKRMGDLDDLSREFAREHSERLWKQLVVPAPDTGRRRSRRERTRRRIRLAVAAAITIKVPTLFESGWSRTDYTRNLGLFVVPLLSGYFAVEADGWPPARSPWLAAAFVAAARVRERLSVRSAGLAPRRSPRCTCRSRSGWSSGIAYAGGRWRQVEGRMDFIRFSGEFVHLLRAASPSAAASSRRSWS